MIGCDTKGLWVPPRGSRPCPLSQKMGFLHQDDEVDALPRGASVHYNQLWWQWHVWSWSKEGRSKCFHPGRVFKQEEGHCLHLDWRSACQISQKNWDAEGSKWWPNGHYSPVVGWAASPTINISKIDRTHIVKLLSWQCFGGGKDKGMRMTMGMPMMTGMTTMTNKVMLMKMTTPAPQVQAIKSAYTACQWETKWQS